MLPRTVNIANERKRQIDTLKIFNDCVVEVVADCEYEIEFNAGLCSMSLEVILPPEFPNEKPIIRVSPQVSHPWVGPNYRDITSAPGLLNFTVHSDLGRVVQAIIREFERNPPPFITDDVDSCRSPTLQHSEGPLSRSSSGTLTKSSSSFGLDNLSESEMEQMLINPDYMDKYIETLPQSIEMDKSISDLIVEIENLANTNLSKKEIIEDLKKGINEKVDKINVMKEKYDKLQAERKELTKPFTLTAITESLRTAAIEADSEAENIATDFLNGSMDVDAFVKRFEERRFLGILRKAKQDRLAHQLKQLNKAEFKK